MSAGETFAITAATVTTIVGALTIWKACLPWARSRRSRTAGLNHLLHGKPDETDAQGKIVEPGYPAIGVQLRELREVVSNGLSERVLGLHDGQADLRRGQSEMRSAIDQMASKAGEAAQLAGQAAATSARVEQQHTEDIARIGGRVEQIDEKVEELREVFKERLEAAEYNAEAWKSVATELGMPWPDERADD